MSGKSELTDSELIARIAEGDMDAMQAFYHRHAGAVERYAMLHLQDRFEIADIIQITMLEVWRTAERFEGRSAVRTWLLSIARFKTLDHLRRQSRLKVTDPQSETFGTPDEIDTEAVVAASEDASRLRACINALPEHQRRAIHLAFFEELTYPQVAEVEGVAEGTLKTRIFHAKKLLMHCLARKQEKD